MLQKPLLYLKLLTTFFGLLTSQISRYFHGLVHYYAYHPTAVPNNVVVIGCSFAGFACAYELSRSLPSGWRVIVIEKGSHFKFTWLSPRVSVLPRHEEKSFIPYSQTVKWAPEGIYVFKQGRVLEIKNDCVFLDSGESISFTYLVLATGTPTRYPYDLNDDDKEGGLAYFRDLQAGVQAADSIAVLGGGPVGVEIALDVKSLYPAKSVTLFHSRDRLCNNYGPALHERCMATAKDLGVEVMLHERPATESSHIGTIQLNSGQLRTFDLLINCAGQKAVDASIPGLPYNTVTSASLIKVKDTLQLQDESMQHIFAIGDVADTGTIKMGRSAAMQGMTAADNIVRLIKQIRPKAYTPGVIERSIDLTLGLGRKLVFIDDKETNLSFASKTSDETLRAEQMWKMLGADVSRVGGLVAAESRSKQA